MAAQVSLPMAGPNTELLNTMRGAHVELLEALRTEFRRHIVAFAAELPHETIKFS
jgi:hypothetical protein